MEKVEIRTEDGVTLAGVWMAPTDLRASALLLHMMPATKESYASLQKMLAARGVASLAIDLRGHGESVRKNGSFIDYQLFEDADHQESRFDVAAAAAWVASRAEFGLDRLALVGASIGANLALEFAAAHPSVPAIVALSPGLVYRGIAAMPAVKALVRTERLLLAASTEDTYSAEAVDKLAEISLAQTVTRIFPGDAHGTAMFTHSPEFLVETADWIAAAIAPAP